MSDTPQTTRQIKIKVKKAEPVAEEENVVVSVAQPSESDKIAEAHFKLVGVVKMRDATIAKLNKELEESCKREEALTDLLKEANKREEELTKERDDLKKQLEEKCEALVNAGNQLEGFYSALKEANKREEELKKERDDLKKQLADSGKREKNDNSPDLASGEVWRMVDAKKVKCKYVYPYKAEGGVSLVKTMTVGQKCVGVSTNQKGNTKDNIKVANYELEWLGLKTVRDVKTKTVYAHKDGKFSVVEGEDSFNVRIMVVSAE